MIEFSVKKSKAKKVCSCKIKAKVEVDREGDLVLSLKGSGEWIRILFIRKDLGDVTHFSCPPSERDQLPGITFDSEGRINSQ